MVSGSEAYAALVISGGEHNGKKAAAGDTAKRMRGSLERDTGLSFASLGYKTPGEVPMEPLQKRA